MSEGWGWLLNARKWHYFGPDHRALCGKWMRMSGAALETGGDDSPDNCNACRQVLADRKKALEAAK